MKITTGGCNKKAIFVPEVFADCLYCYIPQLEASPPNPGLLRYFEGSAAKGVGSPHTGKDYIWPLALVTQARTSTSDAEILQCLEYLKISAVRCCGSGGWGRDLAVVVDRHIPQLWSPSVYTKLRIEATGFMHESFNANNATKFTRPCQLSRLSNETVLAQGTMADENSKSNNFIAFRGLSSAMVSWANTVSLLSWLSDRAPTQSPPTHHLLT
eukprot:gene21058-biopygen7109